MSARSSARDALAVALLAAAACGRRPAAVAPPEADPSRVKAVAAALLANAPNAGSVRECKPAELHGGLSMTQDTLLRLAGKPVADDPEHAAWLNPPELDAPVARALLEPGQAPAVRQAAATWLAAPFYVVYRIDNVDAPLAIGIKELKIGTVGARLIRYEKSGQPACVTVFFWQNDKARSDWAIAESDKTLVDPVVAKALQDDLHARYLQLVPR